MFATLIRVGRLMLLVVTAMLMAGCEEGDPSDNVVYRFRVSANAGDTFSLSMVEELSDAEIDDVLRGGAITQSEIRDVGQHRQLRRSVEAGEVLTWEMFMARPQPDLDVQEKPEPSRSRDAKSNVVERSGPISPLGDGMPMLLTGKQMAGVRAAARRLRSHYLSRLVLTSIGPRSGPTPAHVNGHSPHLHFARTSGSLRLSVPGDIILFMILACFLYLRLKSRGIVFVCGFLTGFFMVYAGSYRGFIGAEGATALAIAFVSAIAGCVNAAVLFAMSRSGTPRLAHRLLSLIPSGVMATYIFIDLLDHTPRSF